MQNNLYTPKLIDIILPEGAVEPAHKDNGDETNEFGLNPSLNKLLTSDEIEMEDPD